MTLRSNLFKIDEDFLFERDLPFSNPVPEVASNTNLIEYPSHKSRTFWTRAVKTMEGAFVP
jgi:hypothetical protein